VLTFIDERRTGLVFGATWNVRGERLPYLVCAVAAAWKIVAPAYPLSGSWESTLHPATRYYSQVFQLIGNPKLLPVSSRPCRGPENIKES